MFNRRHPVLLLKGSSLHIEIIKRPVVETEDRSTPNCNEGSGHGGDLEELFGQGAILSPNGPGNGVHKDAPGCQFIGFAKEMIVANSL